MIYVTSEITDNTKADATAMWQMTTTGYGAIKTLYKCTNEIVSRNKPHKIMMILI